MNRMRTSVLGSTLHRSAAGRSGAILFATLAALVLIATGCDSGTQEPAAPAPEMPEASEAAPEAAAPSAPADGAAPVAREGEIDSSRFPTEMPEGAAAEVPANFPKDMSVYPGAQPAVGKGIEIEGAPHSLVQFLTNDALADVHRFYSDDLAAKGWTIDSNEQSDAAATIQASKGDCKTNVHVLPAEGGGSDIFVATQC